MPLSSDRRPQRMDPSTEHPSPPDASFSGRRAWPTRSWRAPSSASRGSSPSSTARQTSSKSFLFRWQPSRWFAELLLMIIYSIIIELFLEYLYISVLFLCAEMFCLYSITTSSLWVFLTLGNHISMKNLSRLFNYNKDHKQKRIVSDL